MARVSDGGRQVMVADGKLSQGRVRRGRRCGAGERGRWEVCAWGQIRPAAAWPPGHITDSRSTFPWERFRGNLARARWWIVAPDGSCANASSAVPVLTATADGRRNRVSPAVFLYTGSFGGFAEYARTTLDVISAGVPATVSNHAWSVTGSYVLTGKPTSERGVRPKKPFDPAAGAWGALQIAARYHALRVDPRAVALGFAASGASRKAEAWTVGLNWFVTANVRHILNVERTIFDCDGDNLLEFTFGEEHLSYDEAAQREQESGGEPCGTALGAGWNAFAFSGVVT